MALNNLSNFIIVLAKNAATKNIATTVYKATNEKILGATLQEGSLSGRVAIP